jgi:hypothetical protein
VPAGWAAGATTAGSSATDNKTGNTRVSYGTLSVAVDVMNDQTTQQSQRSTADACCCCCIVMPPPATAAAAAAAVR